jgi:FkbM family methyltransferase
MVTPASDAVAGFGTLGETMLRRQLRHAHWALKRTLGWPIEVATLLFSHQRFVPLLPAWSGRQPVLDREKWSILSFAVRNRIDYATLRQMFVRQEYSLRRLTREKDIQNFYANAVASGKRPLIIDCGANVGFSTAYFSQIYPEALVVAVEPDQGNVSQAKRNCTSGRADILHAAIGSASGRCSIFDPGRGSNALRVELAAEGGIEVLTVPSILGRQEYAAAIPFIIKIDIEGFEGNLFDGDVSWIDRFPLLIIELHDWLFPRQGCSSAFLRAITGRDRDFVLKGGSIFSISNSIGAEQTCLLDKADSRRKL